MNARRFVVTIRDTSPSQALVSPPAPTGLTITPIPRGILAHWSLAVAIAPYKWQYRMQVAAEGWSGWIDTLTPIAVRVLSDAEIVSAGVDADIQIQVRSTDGAGNYSPTEENHEISQSISLTAFDIMEDIPVTLFDVTATDRMFDDDTRNLDDLTQGAIQKFLSPAELVAAQNAALHLDGDGLLGTAEIDGTLASTVVTDAADGETAFLKLWADVGANTTETTAGSQTKVDTRLPAAEKTTLETALGATLAAMSGDGDVILMAVGTNKNLAANKVAIKTDIDLGNVENKSSATIRGEIVDGNLAGTTALLEGAWAAFIAAAGQNDTIPSSAVGSLVPGKLETPGGECPFDSDGNLDSGIGAGGGGTIGIKYGAAVRTAQQVTTAIDSSGRATNLDLTKPVSGQDFDDLPDGTTYKKCTVNQQTGAGRAYTALDASNLLQTGTTNKSIAALEAYTGDDRPIHQAFTIDPLAPVFTEYAAIASGIGTEDDIGVFKFRRQSGDIYIKISVAVKSSDSLGIIGAEILDEYSTPFSPAVTDEAAVASTSYNYYELELEIPDDIPYAGYGTVRLYTEETLGEICTLKEIDVRATSI